MSSKIIFFGTSDFAVPSLNALMDDDRFEMVGIVTQPDRPVGRHAELTAPPVKVATQTRRPRGRGDLWTIQQPEKIKDEAFVSWIKEVGPSCDAFVIVSYGKILPQWLLDLPKHGVVNVHGSLLPRWRGASPIQAAVAAGDAFSGVTIMQIDAQMDHGPILAQATEALRPTDTGGLIHDRLAELGGKTLPDILASYIAGNIRPKEQDHTLATFCKTLSREDGKIDWAKTSEEIERLVRAYNPWPGTWTEINGKRVKVLDTKIANDADRKPGERFIRDGRPYIACAAGTSLELFRVQPEGKQPMSGEDFLRGQNQRFANE